ncbi:DNA cytosine methyltransferase [Geomonas oryzisoli]|uniref:DNA (cytosine-5-)-methyltransferase n=1 Tax=Geomonas oryzisoli TaxID=2847992 RepID=A0ABX8J869_9BACT|nr:DNA cytosine methyltransferase [Geomonas oryzisoli]QWV94221.1 DNA cytosine methyltransferase [Geomonas oryzisoli]
MKSIDLFVGAGGLTEGFKAEGVTSLYANDFDKHAIKTFGRNHPNTKCNSDPIESLHPAKVREELALKRGALDILLGGPPCQGFSTYGKRDPGDPRNQLYQHFLSYIEEFRPKAFVMENVTGILTLMDGKVVDNILEETEKMGYATKVFVLNAANYGVPQSRKRVFIVGGIDKMAVKEPKPTHEYLNGSSSEEDRSEQLSFYEIPKRDKLPPALTVRDAISDLPLEVLLPKDTHVTLPYPPMVRPSQYQTEMRSGSDVILHHSAKQMLAIRRLRLALMKPGDYGRELRARLSEKLFEEELINELLGGKGLRNLDGCRREDIEKEMELRQMLDSGLLDMEAFFKKFDAGGFANKYRRLNWDSPSHTLVAHMARDCSDFVHPEVDRFISVREAARLQSFPDTYYFDGSQFQQFKQIGNAVPPKLAAALAKEVTTHLNYN